MARAVRRVTTVNDFGNELNDSGNAQIILAM